MFLFAAILLLFLSFSVSSILSVSLPLSLTLSRPPEGSTLELHENQSLPVSRPPPFHLVVMFFTKCVCVFQGVVWGILSTFFCASLVLFGRLNPIHLKNKSLGICLRWRGLIKQSKPSLASLCAPANTWLHDLHSDWLVRRWESNSGCSCFSGVSFLILRVAAWSAGPVIQ